MKCIYRFHAIRFVLIINEHYRYCIGQILIIIEAPSWVAFPLSLLNVIIRMLSLKSLYNVRETITFGHCSVGFRSNI